MSYVVDIRRELHQYPELAFDLPKTLAIVRRELDAMGLPYTEKYGKSSIVATLNEEKSHFTIGIRADMDALPIEEKNEVPYKSKIKGQMHACGHDSHTAMLLDTVRKLSEIKEKINCRVKFLFQASEEQAPGGAKLMADDGVMDDIDCIVTLHCDPRFNTGEIRMSEGDEGAISNGFKLNFYGKSTHAASQQNGVDAIMMAVKAYVAIEMMVAKCLPATAPAIFNAGSIHGGEANNIICNECSMFCTVRSWDVAVDAKIEENIKRIIASVAEESRGRAEFERCKYYPMRYNDRRIFNCLKSSAESIVGKEHVGENPRGMGAEDFSFFTVKKPGCTFRLGVRNEEKGCTSSLHQDKFNLDEDALEIGSSIFVKFVLDNMNGIEGV